MRKGFIFNESLCVNCKACVAGCLLENNWEASVRSVFTSGNIINSVIAVRNLSLACNHCETAVCLNGCPARAIIRHPDSGAVIIENSMCLGCKYCQWNCPYDAPKNTVDGKAVIKCNLCYNLVSENKVPACASGCPTGALSYSGISERTDNSSIAWFPEKELNPALEIKYNERNSSVKVIPSDRFTPQSKAQEVVKRNMSGDWSLILFTFLSMLSVSITISQLLSSHPENRALNLWLIFTAGVFSLFHLGRKARAWRAILNITRSPLSIEISSFTLYILILVASYLTRNHWIIVAGTITGLILMISIDAVYYYAERNVKSVLHSGQVFLSALLVTSFFSGFLIPFIFLAIIKIIITSDLLMRDDNRHWSFGLRFLRIALILFTGIALVLGNNNRENFILLLFLSGELADRILFYRDFNPLNINNTINNQKYIRDETKSG